MDGSYRAIPKKLDNVLVGQARDGFCVADFSELVRSAWSLTGCATDVLQVQQALSDRFSSFGGISVSCRLSTWMIGSIEVTATLLYEGREVTYAVYL